MTGAARATARPATTLAALLDGQPALPRRPGVAGALRAARRRPRSSPRCPKALRAEAGRALPPALEVVTERTSDGGEPSSGSGAGGRRAGRDGADALRRPRRRCACRSQAGCAMGCGFCATGQAGFDRHLTAGEIVEQVVRAGPPGARRRPPAVERRLHGHGRAAGQLRPHLGGGRAAPRRPRALGPPPHAVDRRDRARASAGWPTRRCRSTWPCRSTPPTTSCATSSSRSTAATR